MIVARIVGGLGNQMFQYAAAKALAARHGVELRLDIRDFNHYDLHGYGLPKLRVDALAAQSEDLSPYPAWKRRILSRLPTGLSRRYFKERAFGYHPAWQRLGPSAYLDGYFQSERFFGTVADELRSEFVPAVRSRHAENTIVDQFGKQESVALHVRRGDYVTDSRTLAVHGVCGIDYYRRAVQLILERIASPRFHLFSNDIVWALENLGLPDDTLCVDWNSDEPEWDLHLMSRCRHHVIANSSFSWWGAWLATHENQMVICPEPWFNDPRLSAEDLIPARWTRLAKS